MTLKIGNGGYTFSKMFWVIFANGLPVIDEALGLCKTFREAQLKRHEYAELHQEVEGLKVGWMQENHYHAACLIDLYGKKYDQSAHLLTAFLALPDKLKDQFSVEMLKLGYLTPVHCAYFEYLCRHALHCELNPLHEKVLIESPEKSGKLQTFEQYAVSLMAEIMFDTFGVIVDRKNIEEFVRSEEIKAQSGQKKIA